MANILILNGPNLNLLGLREPRHYGTLSLEGLNQELALLAQEAECELECFQSNAESQLIDKIHAALQQKVDFIIINPGGLTHTSVSLRDALLGVSIPFIEIHITNIFARENFRHHSYLSDSAVGIICGFGTEGYKLALQAALHYLSKIE